MSEKGSREELNSSPGKGRTKQVVSGENAAASALSSLEEGEWRNAPRAESAALYDLNMQLAAYAKDAQWEKAVVLLKQALAWSDSRNKDSSASPSDREGVGSYGNSTNSVNSVAALVDSTYPREQITVEPNVVSFNNVITACANAKKQKRAEGIFREMTKERGLRPNIFTYGALVSACAKRGNWEDAVNYLQVPRRLRTTLASCASS